MTLSIEILRVMLQKHEMEKTIRRHQFKLSYCYIFGGHGQNRMGMVIFILLKLFCLGHILLGILLSNSMTIFKILTHNHVIVFLLLRYSNSNFYIWLLEWNSKKHDLSEVSSVCVFVTIELLIPQKTHKHVILLFNDKTISHFFNKHFLVYELQILKPKNVLRITKKLRRYPT